MSLLTEAFEECRMMDKTTRADGYGGVETVWVPGASFISAIVLDNSTEAREAAALGVTNLYTITTRKSVTLMYGDVFNRVSDGKLFRVTSDGTDEKTPKSAGLNMRQVSAEELDALPR